MNFSLSSAFESAGQLSHSRYASYDVLTSEKAKAELLPGIGVSGGVGGHSIDGLKSRDSSDVRQRGGIQLSASNGSKDLSTK